MALVVVPSAKPHNVLWGGWDSAERARLDFVTFPVVQGCLVPCFHVLELLLVQDFCCFLGCRPIESTDQILTVLPASNAAGALLLCFMVQSLFYSGPIISQIDVGFGHESRFVSVPLIERVCCPAPLIEVGQSGCQGSLDAVPLVGFVAELVADGDPGLFDMLDVVQRPVCDEGVQGSDVMDNHLVTWISKFLLGLVIDDVLQTPLVEPEVFGQPLAQG